MERWSRIIIAHIITFSISLVFSCYNSCIFVQCELIEYSERYTYLLQSCGERHGHIVV